MGGFGVVGEFAVVIEVAGEAEGGGAFAVEVSGRAGLKSLVDQARKLGSGGHPVVEVDHLVVVVEAGLPVDEPADGSDEKLFLLAGGHDLDGPTQGVLVRVVDVHGGVGVGSYGELGGKEWKGEHKAGDQKAKRDAFEEE